MVRHDIHETDPALRTAELEEIVLTGSEGEERRQHLPFAYAKRHGILVGEYDDQGRAVLACRRRFRAGDQRSAALSRRADRHPAAAVGTVRRCCNPRTNRTPRHHADDGRDGRGNGPLAHRPALPEPEDLLESEDDAPIIRLINALLTEAIKINASDIHIEPYEHRLVVRFRVDGVLREVLEPARALSPILVSRVKVMAKLDIAEKRLPQDGRISLRIAGRAVDVRVSTLPSGHGERVVMRLLDKQAGRLDLEHLGMAPVNLEQIERIIRRPHGIILVTGPTGSGKTTSLYAMLTRVNDKRRNIMTVEDPIEYYLDGISQTQVQTKVDMTFARGLRAILRQDPDIVMVGEIRDLETAEIAVQASLTGHLVLSTLHTNSAIGAVMRLRDMGVEPFLLSSSLIGVIAQRLVRLLCRAASALRGQRDRAQGARRAARPATHALRRRRLKACNQLGFRAATIFEVVEINEKDASHDPRPRFRTGTRSLFHTRSPSIYGDGIRRVLRAIPHEEALRVTHELE